MHETCPRVVFGWQVIINMMLMVDNLLWTTKGFDDPAMEKLMSDAAEHWKEYKKLESMGLGSEPPATQ